MPIEQNSIEFSVQMAKRFLSDPLAFIAYYWPEDVLYAKQQEILLSVRDNIDTFVHAGTTLGKDRTAAWAALWWFCTRSPARVIISSSSQTQLEDTLFGEIKSLVDRAELSGRSLGIEVSHVFVRKPHLSNPNGFMPLDYIRGKVVERGESFSGHHLDASAGPKMLFILSEASGIDDEIYDAALSQRHHMLVTGNPMLSDGFFARNCLAKDQAHPLFKDRLLRKVVHIDGERDSPNVQLGIAWEQAGGEGEPPVAMPGVLSYQEYRERLVSWPEHRLRTKLRGYFPSTDEDLLFSEESLDVAQRLHDLLFEQDASGVWKSRYPSFIKHGPKALGVDVAEGKDFTVWTVVGRWGVVYKKRRQTRDTSVIPGETLRIMKRFGIHPRYVLFDAGGGGTQHANTLRQRYEDIGSCRFGENADNGDEYKNKRAELYGEAQGMMRVTNKVRCMLEKPVSEWLKSWSFFCIPKTDSILREDLAVLPLQTDHEGRLFLPPKGEKRVGDEAKRRSKSRTIKQILGRSPDDGDSFVLAAEAYRLLRSHRNIESRPVVY